MITKYFLKFDRRSCVALMTDEAKKLSFATKATICIKIGHDTHFLHGKKRKEQFSFS